MNSPAPILGHDPSFVAVLEQVSRLAVIDRPTLVVGARGTGKELVAARLHYLSGRWDGPLVKVNCAALSESLLDSELFGHEAGAFTDARQRRRGRFELAHGGTLILDEIATASPLVQEKILRAVEYGEIERLGGSDTLRVDVRVIGATNADLPTLAATGAFRADLLDRLAFDVISLPPLRRRPADIPLLADAFAVAMAKQLGWSVFPGFSPAAAAALAAHDWPGNVRELKNVVERSLARHDDARHPVRRIVLDPFERPPAAPPPTAAAPQGGFARQVAAFEKRLLETTLQAHHYRRKDAAKALDLGYDQLRRLLKKHAIG